MKRTTVQSSRIRSAGYENDTIEIEFTDGQVYRYKQVPKPIFESFMRSESKGRFLSAYIIPQYEHEKALERIAE